VNAYNPLVAFYDIKGGKREMLFFCCLPRTPLEIFINIKYYLFQGIRDAQLDRYLRYDEKLVVPIIENTPFEKDLADSLAQALDQYPATSAVLVRRHGLYVWGSSWQQAKTM
jgi:predicted metal-binding transcription factor (methanogenesis marker protein 9)